MVVNSAERRFSRLKKCACGTFGEKRPDEALGAKRMRRRGTGIELHVSWPGDPLSRGSLCHLIPISFAMMVR